MADYDSHLDLLPTGLAQPEVPVNVLFNALSPASLFGRQDYASAALTWGYYGGVMMVAGVPTTIANGTITLTASATNYVEATTAGVVSKNTSAFTGGKIPLYIVTTNTTGPTDWVDKRPSAIGMEGSTAGGPVATQEEGATVNATTTTINFVGAGVTATDAGGGTTTVTIPGGGGTKAFVLACSDETTALTVGDAKASFRMPHAMTLTAVRASLKTAAGSGTVTVDINESGTTILSTKLTFDATEKTTTTATTPAVISDAALADDAEITVDIDNIGSGTAPTGLKVTLIGSA